MLKKVLIGAVLFSLLIAVVACSSNATPSTPSPSASKPAVTETPSAAQNNSSTPAPVSATTPEPSGPKPSGSIKATWIEPKVNGDSVTISQSEVVNKWNIHFKVGDKAYMAYYLDGKIYVRSNVCPPCRSIGFSLYNDILVCDRCATKFKAKSGAGISGACVDYPKASVSYEVNGDSITMTKSDLDAAHQDTLKKG